MYSFIVRIAACTIYTPQDAHIQTHMHTHTAVYLVVVIANMCRETFSLFTLMIQLQYEGLVDGFLKPKMKSRPRLQYFTL